jgi:hypothetical protein
VHLLAQLPGQPGLALPIRAGEQRQRRRSIGGAPVVQLREFGCPAAEADHRGVGA